MPQQKEHSSLFSLEALYEMEAERIRGERNRLLAEEQRRHAALELERERQRELERREEAARLEEQRRIEEEGYLARITAETLAREEAALRREREAREAELGLERIRSAERRDGRIARLGLGLVVSLGLWLLGAVGGGLLYAAQSERAERLERQVERERDLSQTEKSARIAEVTRHAQQNQRLSAALDEAQKRLADTEKQLADAREAKPRGASPPKTARPSARPVKTGRTPPPCTGDANDPLNPCLPR